MHSSFWWDEGGEGKNKTSRHVAVSVISLITSNYCNENFNLQYTFPLSSAMFKSSRKSLVPFCPPRLTVEKLQPFHWARVPNECLRTTALKLSDVRGEALLSAPKTPTLFRLGSDGASAFTTIM